MVSPQAVDNRSHDNPKFKLVTIRINRLNRLVLFDGRTLWSQTLDLPQRQQQQQ